MTDKEELIKAAETIGKYCVENQKLNCHETCLLAGTCQYLYDCYNISECMRGIISDVKYSNETDETLKHD